MEPDTQRRYIASHTSMRGIAALLVLFYHLQFGVRFRFTWETATPFFTSGYLWVDLFFILSGFVISYSTRMDARAPFAWDETKRFWWARFARIYPLHLFALFMLLAVEIAISAFAMALGSGRELNPFTASKLMAFIEQLFLLNAFGVSGQITWNVPTWSISAEMVAYAFFPALAWAAVRGGKTALTLMTTASLAFYFSVAATTGILDIVNGPAVLRCLAGFSLGMIIYSLRANFEGLSSSLLTAMQIFAAALVVVALGANANDVLIIPGFFLLVASTLDDRGWLAELLKVRPLHWLGDISYSVYLNHFWVLAASGFILDRALPRLGFGEASARGIVIIVEIALVLAISTLTFERIEKPAKRWLTNRWRSPVRAAP